MAAKKGFTHMAEDHIIYLPPHHRKVFKVLLSVIIVTMYCSKL